MKLAKLVLVAAATNATSERSFSALRQVKTYLCSTCGLYWPLLQLDVQLILYNHAHKLTCTFFFNYIFRIVSFPLNLNNE